MRISATVLESFRLYLSEDWFDEADLIASIKREPITAVRVQRGLAFHSILETPEAYRVAGGYRCGGFSFGDDVMQPVLDQIDRRGVFEVKATVPCDGHTLVCRADQILGAHVYEWKCTESSFDPDKYLDSLQWRVIALALEPLAITYRVACVAEDQAGVLSLKALEHVTAYPYPGLHDDVRVMVRAFADYARIRRLEAYLAEAPAPFPLGGPAFEDSPTRAQLRM